MNSLLNREKHRKNPVSALLARLVFFCILTISISSFAVGPPPPGINQCKSKWTILNANGTTGMRFGDFAVGVSSGTISLGIGSTRSPSTSIDLISAGAAVSTHQIAVNSTHKDPTTCVGYGVDIAWVTSPDGMSMSGQLPGPDIGLSSVTVYLNGVATPMPITTDTLPINLEIISTMTTANTQTSGTYTSPTYVIGVTQNAVLKTLTGTAEATAHTPLTAAIGQTMDFGTIASGSNATTVSVDAFGAVTAPAGVGNALVTVAAGAALTFTIQGGNGLAYNLTISDGALDDVGTGAAMAVTITGDDRPATLNGVIQTVTVTADLTVGSSQPKGSYATNIGSGVPIVITINYN